MSYERRTINEAQTQIARQLAGQHWGQRVAPNSDRDEWITTALADAYAAYYIRAAFGSDEHNKRMSGIQQLLENPEEQDIGWTNTDATRRSYSPAGSTRLSDVPKKFAKTTPSSFCLRCCDCKLGIQAFSQSSRIACRVVSCRYIFITKAF